MSTQQATTTTASSMAADKKSKVAGKPKKTAAHPSFVEIVEASFKGPGTEFGSHAATEY